MGKLIDLTGQKFGRLTVLEQDKTYKKGHDSKWLCICDCGNITSSLSSCLRTGQSKSCGCYHKELIQKIMTKHGKAYNKVYSSYKHMMDRCTNKRNKNYKHYGGRGIKVCDEWKNNPQNFLDWAFNNGYKEGLTIDRIDVNGNYCPENCRWATIEEQSNNRRNSVKITYEGKTLTVTQWAIEKGISKETLYARLRRGWDPEIALSTIPKKRKEKQITTNEDFATRSNSVRC